MKLINVIIQLDLVVLQMKSNYILYYFFIYEIRGETTLDAMIMDGTTKELGAVANLKEIKAAISVARKVMEKTYHSLLVGEDATEFAEKVGFKRENLTTPRSFKQWQDWIKGGRNPNYWKKEGVELERVEGNHDTIGMVALDMEGKISCGTSTNGKIFKICKMIF